MMSLFDNIGRFQHPYRDWLISSFERNMPYDQFVTWQLAGDKLPNATREQILTTYFLRAGKRSNEGGITDEEYRVEYGYERTELVGQAFLGLTVGCAKCHDHKYDPITQKNYYELFSFFNNIKEAGQISFDNAMPSPTMLLPTKEQEKVGQFMQSLIRAQEEKVEKTVRAVQPAFEQWLTAAGNRGIASGVGLKATP